VQDPHQRGLDRRHGVFVEQAKSLPQDSARPDASSRTGAERNAGAIRSENVLGGQMKREFTIEQVDAWGEALLRQAEVDPPQRKLDMKTAIARLKEKIAVAQKKGYSLAEVAEALRTAGLPVAEPTLRKHLNPTRKATRKGAAPSSAGPLGTPEIAHPVPVPEGAPLTDPRAASPRPAPAPAPGPAASSRVFPLPQRFRL
jgi:hypothetical protein